MTVVFPTPVGVFLMPVLKVTQVLGLPHARGGVSDIDGYLNHFVQSSPRPWGCFANGHLDIGWTPVFPTPVGVFLSTAIPARITTGLPHARGGVSVFPR